VDRRRSRIRFTRIKTVPLHTHNCAWRFFRKTKFVWNYCPTVLSAHVTEYSSGRVHCAVPSDKTTTLQSGGQWLHETKNDGFRIIARSSRVRLYRKQFEGAQSMLGKSETGGHSGGLHLRRASCRTRGARAAASVE
jgi:hypothetical protein